MPVVARKEYIGNSRDHVSHYHGNQMVYASWDHHLIFAAPCILYCSPSISFRELVEGILAPLLAVDPDADKIDWRKVEWLKSNQPWQPNFERSLSENGVGHKDSLRFRTPGLNTLCAPSQ